MASFAFNSMLDDLSKGNLLVADTYYVMLTTSAFAADQDLHTKRSDVTNEVTGTGYTAGGLAVVPTFTKDNTNNRLTIVFPAVSWAGSTITARRAVYYKRRGGLATADELIAVDDFGVDISSVAVPFNLAATTLHIGTPV